MLFANFIDLFLESAPWLLLGLVLAGMLKMFVPMSWMKKQLGGHGLKVTIKAAVLGAPLPLCSCGVIPAAIGLRRSGASKAATTSFLVSTPETGVDSVTISYVLLGPFMAIVRPIAAIISAIVAGILVGRDEEIPKDDKEHAQVLAATTASSCCGSLIEKVPEKTANCCSSEQKNVPKKACCGSGEPLVAHSVCGDKDTNSCCETTNNAPAELHNESILKRIGKGLHYGATDLVRDTTIWLLIGLFFAALVQTYVPSDFLVKWGDGLLAMLVMVIISVPMYICATASTPIAAGLLLAGVSPGAVLVFMLAGPATNIATLGVVSKELGKRALLGYLGGVLGVALISGIVVNYLVERFGFNVMPQIGEHYSLLPSGVVYTSGMILAALMLKVLFAKLPKNWWRRDCC
ncbi:SO_0444 family Cu/Zn efflux transporter [Shewanella surugensis]|uniref:SO_0444 family Cu/Zn efflux transporter n=1 Tax=Shewanella surugensis TaxID=212020 RepID=A0ABT0LEI3_9GAMM|nr:SO_0444 family Cu/Zn efflux transporter [Shewanella surugensis]MCL1126065.1 SO_0444 family Cu/Zn efflux transporter [Shewanella surugensis]